MGADGTAVRSIGELDGLLELVGPEGQLATPDVARPEEPQGERRQSVVARRPGVVGQLLGDLGGGHELALLVEGGDLHHVEHQPPGQIVAADAGAPGVGDR